MKTLQFINKVKESQGYNDLMKEDSKSYLCSLFFTRDYQEKKNETQVDFYSPKKDVIISFKVDKKVERIRLDKKAETIAHKKFIPKPLGNKIKMGIEEIRPTLMDEMHNRSMADEINKLMVVLHIMDERIVWNCTGFLKGLGLIQAHVEDESESVLFMEKKNFFDLLKFVKKVEPGGLAIKEEVKGEETSIKEDKDDKKSSNKEKETETKKPEIRKGFRPKKK